MKTTNGTLELQSGFQKPFKQSTCGDSGHNTTGPPDVKLSSEQLGVPLLWGDREFQAVPAVYTAGKRRIELGRSGPVLLDPRLEMSMTTQDKHSRKYVCALLGTPQSRENVELWWHFSPEIHETQGFSTVDRMGACKSKESGDDCCGVQIRSVQCGEEICRSVYSSRSSAWKHDLLEEILEMQLLLHYKKRGEKKKRGGEEGGKKKIKPKRNQTKNKSQKRLLA